MNAASQVYSRDFDADFFKLTPETQRRIQSAVDHLSRVLDTHAHHRKKGLEAFRLRVDDYRVIYTFDLAKGVLHLLAVGHRREVYRF